MLLPSLINTYSVLVVEDNLTDVLLLEESLGELDEPRIVLSHASRLDAALICLEQGHFDAVLLDLGLPDSQGLETFARVQARYPTLPIFILSGLQEESIATAAIQRGAQDYLLKGNLDGRSLVRAMRYGIERKRASENLEASEISYRRLFEASQDGIFILDAVTGEILEANPYLEVLLGFPPHEFVGSKLWEIPPFQQRLTMDAAFAMWLHCGYRRFPEMSLLNSAGNDIAVELVCNVYDVGGKQVIQFNLRDISERKSAEAERDRFFTMSVDMLCIGDLAGTLKRLNPAFAQTMGYSVEELVGQNVLELFHPSDRDAGLLALGVSTLESCFESRCRNKDGTWRWLEWKLVVDSGTGTFYAIARDITKRMEKNAEFVSLRDALEARVAERTQLLDSANLELRRQKTILECQGEASIDGILVLDSGGQLVFHNSRLMEMWQLPAPVMAGGDGHEALTVMASRLRSPEAFLERLQQLEQNGSDREHEEFELLDGRTFTSYTAPVDGVSVESYGRIWFFQDMTLARDYESSIRLARDQADNANVAKSDFLAGMSHELRTPLNAILGFGQMLEMNPDNSGPDQEAIGHILKGGRHLLSLINEVLDIASIEAGRLTFQFEVVDLRTSVSDVLSLMGPLAVSQKISIENHLPQDAPVVVLADRRRLHQLLLNLLSNAIKYNRAEGEVIISWKSLGGNIRLSVADTGAGLSPTDLEKLFNPFERLGAANTEIEGSGIGLALCKRLCEAMGGRIGVVSQVGEGSTFWFEFPKAGTAEPGPVAVGKNVVAPSQELRVEPVVSTRKILYVEDNRANFLVIKSVLSLRPDLELIPAVNGKEGVELARLHRPSLILLDLHLSDMSGNAVLQLLKQDPTLRHIPVIILSADAMPQHIEALREQGAADYLTKPLELKPFLQVLLRLLPLLA